MLVLTARRRAVALRRGELRRQEKSIGRLRLPRGQPINDAGEVGKRCRAPGLKSKTNRAEAEGLRDVVLSRGLQWRSQAGVLHRNSPKYPKNKASGVSASSFQLVHLLDWSVSR